MKTVLKTLLFVAILMSMVFVTGCSKTTEPIIFTDDVTIDDFKVYSAHRWWLSAPNVDFVRIWDLSRLNRYINSYTNQEKISHINDDGNPIRLVYFDILESYQTRSFFQDSYLIIIRSSIGGGFLGQTISGIDSDGTVNFLRHEDCCGLSVDLHERSYIFILPKTFRPETFQSRYTVEYFCSMEDCENYKFRGLLPHEFDFHSVNTRWFRRFHRNYGIGFEHFLKPVLINNHSEMETYLRRYEDICFGMWDKDWNPIRPYYFDVLEQFTEEFFSKRYLCMIRTFEWRSSNCYDVKKIGADGIIHIEWIGGDANRPDSNTILIELPISFRPESFSIEMRHLNP